MLDVRLKMSNIYKFILLFLFLVSIIYLYKSSFIKSKVTGESISVIQDFPLEKPVSLLCRRVRTDTQHDYSQGNCTLQCRLRFLLYYFVKSRKTRTACLKSAYFFLFCVKFFKPLKYSLCIFFILRNKSR